MLRRCKRFGFFTHSLNTLSDRKLPASASGHAGLSLEKILPGAVALGFVIAGMKGGGGCIFVLAAMSVLGLMTLFTLGEIREDEMMPASMRSTGPRRPPGAWRLLSSR